MARATGSMPMLSWRSVTTRAVVSPVQRRAYDRFAGLVGQLAVERDGVLVGRQRALHERPAAAGRGALGDLDPVEHRVGGQQREDRGDRHPRGVRRTEVARAPRRGRARPASQPQPPRHRPPGGVGGGVQLPAARVGAVARRPSSRGSRRAAPGVQTLRRAEPHRSPSRRPASVQRRFRPAAARR